MVLNWQCQIGKARARLETEKAAEARCKHLHNLFAIWQGARGKL